MKKLFSLLLLPFLFAAVGNAQSAPFLCPADTLQGIEWAYLSGPPAKVTGFVQCKERVFAATEAGLFFSDDDGETWSLQPQTKGKKIENLFANDSVVLFQYLKTLSIGPVSTPTVRQLEIYRSLNTGLDFDMIYTLDGDSEYFGVLLYPYLWTKFIDLGEGFMYFEHGVPYPGFGPSDPYDNSRYFSPDYGKHWNKVSLTYTGTNTPMSKIFQNLSFCRDTLLGIQYIFDTSGNGNDGYQINLYPQGRFEGNPIQDTLQPLPIQSGFQNFLYFNRDLYHVSLGFGNFKPYIKRFSGVLSDNFPSAVATDTLYFPNEPIQNPTKFWNTDTLLWFEFGNRNVYRSTIQNPQTLIFQYKKPAQPAWATSFARLPAGLYANNTHFETLHSTDNGNTWSKSDDGLSIAAFTLGDQCNQVLASPRLEGYPTSSIYYKLSADGAWEYLDSTLEKTLRWPVGKAFGNFYMSSGSRIYKTAVCADPPEWQIATLNANSWGDTLFQAGNRAFAYRKHCGGCKVYVSYDGESWSESGFYTDGTMSVFGDTIVQFQNDKVRFSTDLGLNWLDVYFPQEFNFSWIVYENQQLIALNELDSSLQWLVCSNLLHADDPNNWHGECILAKPYHAYTAFGDVAIPAKMVEYSAGFIFLHAQEGLYISNDASKSWHRLPDLPFKNEFERPHYTTGQIQYGLAEGGNGYRVLDGYLYAFTNLQGVWKTDLQPILAQLPEVVLNTTSMSGKRRPLETYPNPASDYVKIQLPEGIHNGGLYVFSPLMRMIHTEQFEGNLVQFQTEDLNPGVYFLQVQTASGDTFFAKLIVSRK